jgi:uncharacterized protein YbjT (DUF2867 family)
MARVLVTGASGFVGSHTLPVLIERGHDIVALVRSDLAVRTMLDRLAPAARARVEPRTGDVTNPATLPGALDGADLVLHLVAIPRDRDGGTSLSRVNTEGTQNVVDAMKRVGPGRLLHQSALGVVDDPSLHYASSKAQAEQLVRDSGLDWTITKPSLLWGERDGFFNILAGLARLSPGVMPIAGSGTARFQPLAVDELARVLADIIERPETIGQVYELGGPRYLTYREIVAEVLHGMGKRRLMVPVPVPLIALVAGTAEHVGLAFPVATDQLRQLRIDNVGPLDGVERNFGFAPIDIEGQLGYLRRRLSGQEPTRTSH